MSLNKELLKNFNVQGLKDVITILSSFPESAEVSELIDFAEELFNIKLKNDFNEIKYALALQDIKKLKEYVLYQYDIETLENFINYLIENFSADDINELIEAIKGVIDEKKSKLNSNRKKEEENLEESFNLETEIDAKFNKKAKNDESQKTGFKCGKN